MFFHSEPDSDTEQQVQWTWLYRYKNTLTSFLNKIWNLFQIYFIFSILVIQENLYVYLPSFISEIKKNMTVQYIFAINPDKP